jgi:AraC family transcriptional regulator
MNADSFAEPQAELAFGNSACSRFELETPKSSVRSPAASRIRKSLAPWQERLAKELMCAHLVDGIGLDRVATICGLSSSALTRGFKRSNGLAPHQWLMRRRLALAMELMHNRQISLAEVALQSGFSDQSHFTRVFTARVGISPGAWRSDLAY